MLQLTITVNLIREGEDADDTKPEDELYDFLLNDDNATTISGDVAEGIHSLLDEALGGMPFSLGAEVHKPIRLPDGDWLRDDTNRTNIG